MSKYIDLAEKIVRDHMKGPITGLSGESYALEWLDDHPEHVPGRTITESEYRFYENESGEGNMSVAGLLRRLGIEIIPNPEPTNVEKLADVYRDWSGGDEVPNSLIRFMDKAGVTAPEETK